jgi:hypothetical protein
LKNFLPDLAGLPTSCARTSAKNTVTVRHE